MHYKCDYDALRFDFSVRSLIFFCVTVWTGVLPDITLSTRSFWILGTRTLYTVQERLEKKTDCTYSATTRISETLSHVNDHYYSINKTNAAFKNKCTADALSQISIIIATC